MVIIIVDRSTIKVTLPRRSRANESLLYRQAKRIYRVQNERGWQSSAAIRLNWTHMCTAQKIQKGEKMKVAVTAAAK